MEPSHLIAEEWGSLSGLCIADESDFMAQLLGGNYSVTENHCGNTITSFGMPSVFWPGHESTIVTMTDTNSNSHFPSNVANANTNSLCFSQGSSSSTDSGNVFSTTTDQATNIESLSMFFCLGDAKLSPHGFQWDDNLSLQISEFTDEGSGKLVLADNNLQAKREHEMMVSEPSEEDGSKNLENPAKRFRSSIEVEQYQVKKTETC